MRKNRTKHEAKKPRLAKRALALCFALIFVCSCLLPVFAHSEAGALAGPQETVVEEQQEEQSTNDPTGNDTNPTGNDTNPTGNDTKPTEGGEEPKPVEPEQKPAEPEQPKVEEQPKTEGATEESKDTTGETKPEEPKTEETKPEEQPKTEGTTEESKDTAGETKPAESKPTNTTTGDTINQGEAVYTYRFWTKEIDAFDLEQVNLAVNNGENLIDAAKSATGIAPCEVLKVANHAHLADYTVTEPTKDGYVFAGWYTLEDGTAYEFSFDQNVSFEKSKTIDVFAKWEKVKAEVKQVELGGKNVSVEVEGAPALNVSQLSDTAAEELGKKVLDKIDWDEFNVIYMFDLEPKDSDGLAIDSAKKVTISGLNIDSSEDVKVFHLGTNFEEVPAEVSDGTLTFTPSSFSPFAIVTVDNSSAYSVMAVADGVAEYASQSVQVVPGGTTSITGTSSGWHEGWSHRWNVTSGTGAVSIQGSSNDQQKITIKAANDVEDGSTAEIEHKYWKVTAHLFWTEYKQEAETFSITVSKFKDNKNDQIAAIYYLKDPNDDVTYNQMSHWAPDANSSNILAKIHTDNSGKNGKWPTWTPGWQNTYPNETNPNKNILTTTAQRVDDYIDGSATIGLELRTDSKGYKVFVVSKTITDSNKEEKTNPLFTQIWTSVSNNPNYNSLTKDGDKKIKEIILTPKKISRENGSGNQEYHIDCTLTVVNEETYEAKFWVNDPDTLELWSPACSATYPSGSKTYKEGQAIEELKEFRVSGTGNILKIGDTKIASDGITYKLVGWYLESETTGHYEQDSRILGSADWNHHSDKGTTIGYMTHKGDDVRTDGVVNFYARYVPEDTKHDQDAPYIFVEKEVKGIAKNQLPGNFCITVDGNEYDLNRKDGDIIPNSDGSGFKIRWKIGNVSPGTHTVGEDHYKVTGYNVEVKVNGTPVTNPSTNPAVSVDVTPKTFGVRNDGVITTNREQTFDFGVYDGVNHIFAISINSSQKKKNIIISKEPLSVSQRASVAKTLKEMTTGEGSTFSNNPTNEFYSLQEESRIVVENGTITYNAANNTVTISAKSVWNKVAKMSYKVEEGNNPEVSITNTYTPATTSLTVTKTATKDGVVDTTKEFDFTLTLGSKSENVTWSKDGSTGPVKGTSHKFTLKGGESITFSGISVEDTNVTVTEDDYSAQHYTTTIDGRTGHEITIPESTLRENQNTGTTVNFTNAYTTPKLPSMTIKKVVTGAFGERTKDFTFSVTLKHANPTLLEGVTATGAASKDNLSSFTMRHGNSVTLGNIPIDTIITVTEKDANDYKTSATGHKNSIKNSGARTFTYKVEEQNGEAVLVSLGTDSEGFNGNAIIVENNFDGTPDTGVLLDTLPYLILLAVAVAGGVLVVVRKRKHRDE